jgi:hypothetical protein
MSTIAISIDEAAIAAFCERHGVHRLAVFGSALGEGFGPDSDIDVLVDFLPGRTPGLAFFAMEAELSDIIGRTVDLNTPGFLSSRFREHVQSSAHDIYVAA